MNAGCANLYSAFALRLTGRFTNSQPIFPFRQRQSSVEWPPLLGNKSLQEVAFAFQQHFAHLVRGDFTLENGFAHFERATPLGEIFADVGCACIVNLSTFADLAFANDRVQLADQ